ncbi:uncharacterized protein Bfra_009106 [Botrytis fragariae]|uniref:BTB domain-containing protein n=1 Tax=Botrytis fragariae TaxID=1964551 RepID=A0A8H6AR47_9HELO|nr:uncharacterized protein Bfra_009106 [Botrytis fragariae]KAF5872077.1 hypothetical protein Bfra_009106 [Botrytis fragariae]
MADNLTGSLEENLNSAITIIASAEMLAQYSPFFEDVNNSYWQPGGTKRILLEKGLPETFAMVVPCSTKVDPLGNGTLTATKWTLGYRVMFKSTSKKYWHCDPGDACFSSFYEVMLQVSNLNNSKLSDDFNDAVEIIAGTDEKKLRHQFASKVLALRSKYFRVKIKNYSYLPHSEDERMIINLSEQSIVALEAFLAWNSTGTIRCGERLSAVTVDRDAAVVTTEKLDKYRLFWDRLLEFYLLKDFLGASAFCNSAINTLIGAIDSESQDRAKFVPKLEVFAPILGVDDPEDNQNHLNDAENHKENEEDDNQHVEDQW